MTRLCYFCVTLIYAKVFQLYKIAPNLCKIQNSFEFNLVFFFLLHKTKYINLVKEWLPFNQTHSNLSLVYSYNWMQSFSRQHSCAWIKFCNPFYVVLHPFILTWSNEFFSSQNPWAIFSNTENISFTSIIHSVFIACILWTVDSVPLQLQPLSCRKRLQL